MKKKIAVIGGGLSSITAVYNIMKTPGAKEKYDITVYQTGWRLGGKGASGVNLEKGCRVEEHGIHFWFGFYENGFHLMKEVYRKLNRPKDVPLADFEAAFKKQPFMYFAEKMEKSNTWHDQRMPFPHLPGKVGDGNFINPIDTFVYVGVEFLIEIIEKYLPKGGCLPKFLHRFKGEKSRPVIHASLSHLVEKLEAEFSESASHVIVKFLRITAKLLSVPEHLTAKNRQIQVEHLDHLKHWIWELIGKNYEDKPDLLFVWCNIDLFLTILRGMVADKVITTDESGKYHLDMSVINEYDFMEWLIKNGSQTIYLFNNPVVRSMYDGPFAFMRGSVPGANIEAGTALGTLLRLALTCKEEVMWRMQAGMGDTVFTPIYQLLKKEFPENVHFEFFHKANHLKLSEDKQKVVAIEFEKQVNLAEGLTEYTPLYNVKGLDCWTTAPLYEQLDPAQAAELKKRDINLEDCWSGWKGELIVKELDKDFDEVLIGASLSSLPDFCNELIHESKAWGDMLDEMGTVQTQAFQLWLTKNPQELGVEKQKVLSTYVEPLDTFAEMNQVLEKENWSPFGQEPQYLFYVCGAMPDAGTIPPYSATYFSKEQEEEVFQNAKDYILKDLKHVLPGAFDKNGQFDWNILFDPENRVGEERLRYQYFRANLNPTERYVYALKNTSKYRLKAHESGFQNVVLTGDWIQNSINIGCVEGAVVSGLYAARVLTGDEEIPIYLPW